MTNVVHIDTRIALTIRQVADVFDVDERTIRRWCDDDPGRSRPPLPRRADRKFEVMTVILWAVAFDVAVPTPNR